VLPGKEINVEVKGADFLYAFAVMTITAGGFFALLLGIRQAVSPRLALLEGYLAKTSLIQVFTLTGGALLPPLLGLYDLPETWLWRIAAAGFGIPMLVLLLSYPLRRRKAVGRAPPSAVFAGYVVLGSATIVGMLIYVIGGFKYQAAAYITALTINFFTAASAFVAGLDIIMRQPDDPFRK
jgi:hypothetical protein